MSSQLKCEEVRAQLALLLYGELSFDQEEQVESHMDHCAKCRAALEGEQARHRALDSIEITPSPSLLHECREDLFEQIAQEPAPRPPAHAGWWDQFVDLLTRPASWLKPAAAMGLIAVGFFGGRFTPLGSSLLGGSYQGASLVGQAGSRVRTVEPVSNGRVQIVIDDTVERTVAGRVDDDQIRALLLAAANDPSDAGLRSVTVDILNTRAQAADIRDVLIFRMLHDQNSGVRLKAIDGLRPFAGDLAVRGALAQALLSDSNPGLRKEAIDLLTKSVSQDSGREIVPALQQLMQSERNTYVRQQCLRALEAMKASADTY